MADVEKSITGETDPGWFARKVAVVADYMVRGFDANPVEDQPSPLKPTFSEHLTAATEDIARIYNRAQGNI